MNCWIYCFQLGTHIFYCTVGEAMEARWSLDLTLNNLNLGTLLYVSQKNYICSFHGKSWNVILTFFRIGGIVVCAMWWTNMVHQSISSKLELPTGTTRIKKIHRRVEPQTCSKEWKIISYTNTQITGSQKKNRKKILYNIRNKG